MVGSTAAIICGRIRRCLETVSLRRRSLACSSGRLRRVAEGLYMMRVKDEVVEVRNLNPFNQY